MQNGLTMTHLKHIFACYVEYFVHNIEKFGVRKVYFERNVYFYNVIKTSYISTRDLRCCSALNKSVNQRILKKTLNHDFHT